MLPSYVNIRHNIGQEYGGGTVFSFEAPIAVHRKHTKKGKYVVQTAVASIMFTDWDKVRKSKKLLKQYSENILKSLQGTAEQGWYYEEVYKHGEYSNVKRYYNNWYWYDKKKNKMFKQGEQ